jgi:outer membrane protein assembly factor BamB
LFLLIISCSRNKEENDKSVLYLTELVTSNLANNNSYPSSKPTTTQNINIRNSESKNTLIKESQVDFSICSVGKCKFQFRADYKEFLQLKYYFRIEIVYYSDLKGYYYYTYNPKSRKFDLQVRVGFKTVKYENQTFETNIDIETQSGIISAKGGANKINWTYLLPSLPTLPVTRIGNQILICTQDGTVISLNPITGTKNWMFLSPGSILIEPMLYNDRIIVFDDSGNMFWLDPDTGSLRNRYLLEEMPVPSPVLRNNNLIVANSRGYLHAIRMADASASWRDHSLMGAVERMNDSDGGFIVHGANSALFSYHNGAKQKILGRTIQE